MKKKVSIVNYGVGNIGSLVNIVSKSGAEPDVIDNPLFIKKSSNVILPGVGSFDNAMQKLKETGFRDALYEHVLINSKPILGVCVGMQLLTRGSEEGKFKGMGVIDADTFKFDINKLPIKFPIPHMGWNKVEFKKDSVFYDDSVKEQRFYFVHSYHVCCDNEDDIMTETEYGYNFASSFQKENIIGVQFHPEKSHSFGIKFFDNYIKYIAI